LSAASLAADNLPGEASRLTRCGEEMLIKCKCCARERPVPKCCKRKWCPDCARRASAETVAIYDELVRAMRWPLFWTVTVHHTSNERLAETYEKLRKGLKIMKGLTWFKNKVRGGVGAVEISAGKTFDEDGNPRRWNGWHPHAHLLMDCTWLSVTYGPPRKGAAKSEVKKWAKLCQEEVLAQWRLATGDPKAGMFVRRARKDTVSEVLKYAVSTEAMTDPRGSIAELVEVIRGRKAVMPWGTIRKGLSILRKERKILTPPNICECGSEAWAIVQGEAAPALDERLKPARPPQRPPELPAAVKADHRFRIELAGRRGAAKALPGMETIARRAAEMEQARRLMPRPKKRTT